MQIVTKAKFYIESATSQEGKEKFVDRRLADIPLRIASRKLSFLETSPFGSFCVARPSHVRNISILRVATRAQNVVVFCILELQVVARRRGAHHFAFRKPSHLSKANV